MYELRQHHQYTCDVPKCGTAVTYDGARFTREQADRKVGRECGFVTHLRGDRVIHFCEEHSDYILKE